MATNVDEIEIKYEAPENAALPALDHLPRVTRTSRPSPQRLEAEYFDTADLRLIRSGITLRRRRGGDDAGWHLKLPAGPQVRREVRLPLGPADQQVPAELATLVRARTRGAQLKPVARMTTARELLVLHGEQGQSLAEVCCDEVSAQTLGEPSTATSWREVEVELTGGDRELLAAADAALRGCGMRRARRTAKLERALGVERPLRREPELRPASPAGQVIKAVLGSLTSTLTSLDPMVRGDEPDAVHQMRVTTRRLRSTLQAFGGYTGQEAGHLADELKWLGALLGEARDAEVLSARLLDNLEEMPAELVIGPVQARVRGHFASVRARARAAVIDALDSERYFALLDGLDQLTARQAGAQAAGQPAGAALPREVWRTYRTTRRRMRRALHSPAGPARDAALHQARKAAKRARYAAEAVAPALGADARRFGRRMKNLQTVLGDHQDTVVARQATRQLGISAHLAGENAFSYGLLYEQDACDAWRLEAGGRRAWAKASRPRYLRWMR
jgi:CHAD domain-containing protein